MTHPTEKAFARKCRKAGWHTYRDEDTGRVVTNAYEDERVKLQNATGMDCEVVSRPFAEGCCVRIGPVLKPIPSQEVQP